MTKVFCCTPSPNRGPRIYSGGLPIFFAKVCPWSGGSCIFNSQNMHSPNFPGTSLAISTCIAVVYITSKSNTNLNSAIGYMGTWIRQWGMGIGPPRVRWKYMFLKLRVAKVEKDVYVFTMATGRLRTSCLQACGPLTFSYILPKMKRGQDIQLSICSYVAEKPCGCLYKLTCCNTKFHSLFKCKLYL